MSEQFANKYSSTVASAYTAGSGTLIVASATGLPATGDFRIRLGNVAGSILKVTARAGTTLTVTVEQDDGNASIGDTVKLVNTAGAMLALKADAIAAGGNGMPWWPTLGDPTVPAFAWQNQGAATVVDGSRLSYLSMPSTAINVRSRLLSAPATPYTITALLHSEFSVATTQQFAGLVFRESSTGKLWTAGFYGNGLVQATRYTNDTTFSATVAGFFTALNMAGHWNWLRITDDGVNLIFAMSQNGVNYKQVSSEGRTVFMAGGPNQVGLCANVDAAAGAFQTSFVSWIQS